MTCTKFRNVAQTGKNDSRSASVLHTNVSNSLSLGGLEESKQAKQKSKGSLDEEDSPGIKKRASISLGGEKLKSVFKPVSKERIQSGNGLSDD